MDNNFKKRDNKKTIKYNNKHEFRKQSLLEEENKQKNDYKNFIKSLQTNQDHDVLDEYIENLAEHLKHLSYNIQLLKDMFILCKKMEANKIKDE